MAKKRAHARITDSVRIGDKEYPLEDVYEPTKQSLIPRVQQLVITLTETNNIYPSDIHTHMRFYTRSVKGLVVLPSGDWYSNVDWTSGNIISLVQYLTGMDVYDTVEWVWKEFIKNTSADWNAVQRALDRALEAEESESEPPAPFRGLHLVTDNDEAQ